MSVNNYNNNKGSDVNVDASTPQSSGGWLAPTIAISVVAAAALIGGVLAWKKGVCKSQNHGSNVDLNTRNTANVQNGGKAEEMVAMSSKRDDGVLTAPNQFTGNEQQVHLLEGGNAAHGNSSLPGPITRDFTTGHQPEAEQMVEPSDVRLDIEQGQS